MESEGKIFTQGLWITPWRKKGRMTKSELVEILANQQDQMSRREAEFVVNMIFSSIGDALGRGERVELRGFGSFYTKQRNARTGRNPKTGDTVQVPAKVVPQFKPGKQLRERVDAIT